MNKLFLLTAALAAGMAVTSCSSDKEEVAVDNKIRFNANGEAYFSVQIQTPTEGTTRAFEPDQFVGNATDAEAKVNNAVLLLFAGANENDATFQAAYQLTGSENDAAIDNDVQKTYTITVTNDEKITANNLYAFVALNYTGVFTVEGKNVKIKLSTGSEEEFKASDNLKFSAFKKKEINLWGTSGAMLMTNAPQSDKKGGNLDSAPSDITITTLAPISTDNLYTKQTDATDNPVKIYVERVVAKVSVTSSANTLASPSDAVMFVKDDVKWAADNQEPTFYPVRNVSTDYLPYRSSLSGVTNKYRFMSNKQENTTDNDERYRIYWAEDPHYAYTASDYNTKQTGFTPASAYDKALGATEYIHENTFNEWGMSQDKTTRVVVMIPFKSGENYEDFYTLNGVDEILSKTGAEGKILEYVKDLAAVKTFLKNDSHNDPSKITVELGTEQDTKKGSTTITVKYNETDNSDLNTAVGTNLAETLSLKLYKGGKSYYKVLIHHFDDEAETPLGDEANEDDAYKRIYGTTPSPQNYLGRFGVVRNTFYAISIESVKHIGEPVVPPTTPDTGITPDDEKDKYLSTKIYVTKWAKREWKANL